MKNLLMVKTITHFGHTAGLVAVALLAAACGGSGSGSSSEAIAASAVPSLGSAGSFEFLSKAVSCTDAAIPGNVGATIAFSPVRCTVGGTTQLGPAAVPAYNDFLIAYDQFKALQCDPANTYPVAQRTLAGLTLPPGVYCFEGYLETTSGVLTLDGPADGLWIFKVGTGGTPGEDYLTGTSFSVVMKDGSTPPCNPNVYWWVAQAVTMTDSHLVGTILAGSAITFTNGTFNGNAFAKVAETITGPIALTACGAGGGTPAPVCKDFVTGGGWICLDDGLAKTDHGKSKCDSKGTFGVSGGIKHGKFWGHLEYTDHGKDMKVKSMKGTGVTAYEVVNATTRRIKGNAKINGVAGTYEVVVADNGEPGHGVDTFSLSLSNGYSASGDLKGGNIQLHRKCRPQICVPSDKGNSGDDGDDDECEEHEGNEGHDWHEGK